MPPVVCACLQAYLNGIDVPSIFFFKTLVVKLSGSVGAVAGGLAVGKEGPFVHAGEACQEAIFVHKLCKAIAPRVLGTLCIEHRGLQELYIGCCSLCSAEHWCNTRPRSSRARVCCGMESAPWRAKAAGIAVGFVYCLYVMLQQGLLLWKEGISLAIKATSPSLQPPLSVQL